MFSFGTGSPYGTRKAQTPTYLGQAYHSPISLCEACANAHTSSRYSLLFILLRGGSSTEK